MASIIGFILVVILYISHVKSNISLDKNDLVGIYPPVFTPYNKDFKINYNVIPRYAKFLADNGIPGVVVAGTNGESSLITLEERMRLSDAWMAAGKQYNLQIILQITALPFPDALKLAKYAEKTGVDGILALPELYYRPTKVEELVQFIKLLADQAPNTSIFYYDIPPATDVNINMVDFFKNATYSIPSFCGLKTGMNNALQVMAATELQSYQRLFVRTDLELTPTFQMNLSGTISAVCNIFPKICTAIVTAVQNKNFSQARDLQLKLNKVIAAIAYIDEDELAAIGRFKAAMEIVTGIPVGELRKPQKPIPNNAKMAITQNLMDLKLKMTKNNNVNRYW